MGQFESLIFNLQILKKHFLAQVIETNTELPSEEDQLTTLEYVQRVHNPY